MVLAFGEYSLVLPKSQKNLSFGYKPQPNSPKRVAILEPKVNVIKTRHYPLLVCEEAYRLKRSM